MPIEEDRRDRFETKLTDIEILSHPDPEIEKKIRGIQGQAKIQENESKK